MAPNSTLFPLKTINILCNRIVIGGKGRPEQLIHNIKDVCQHGQLDIGGNHAIQHLVQNAVIVIHQIMDVLKPRGKIHQVRQRGLTYFLG